MAIFVFHGDHIAASRQGYRAALDKEKAGGAEIRELAGDKLSAKDLESTLATENLFSSEALAIEGLLSRAKSKEKDTCLKLLNAYSGKKNVYLWEKKEVPKTILANLPSSAKISLSKAPSVMFTFLDSLYPGNAKRSLSLLHELAQAADELFIFTMCSRTVANLLVAQSGKSPKLSPWQLSKLRGQSAKWAEKDLLAFHDRLLAIDYAIKSGRSRLSYLEHLDILLLTVLG